MSQEMKRLDGSSAGVSLLAGQSKPEILTEAERLSSAGKWQDAMDLLRPYSSKSRLAEQALQGLERQVKVQHGLATLPVLMAFTPMTPEGVPLPSGVLDTLKSSLEVDGKTLPEAFNSLSATDQKLLESQVGSATLKQFLFISESSDPTEYWSDLVLWAVEKKNTYQPKDTLLAGQVLAYVVEQGDGVVPGEVLKRAQGENAVLTGGGTLGQRIEGFSGNLLHQATDAKMIAPMVLASPVFHLGRAATLRGLLATGVENPFTRGIGARAIAGGTGLIGETAFFSLSSRGLTHAFDGPVPWDANSVLKDMGAAGLTLGLLKSVGFLGRQGMLRYRGLNELNPALWNKLDHRAMFWSGQASGYLGLVTAHFTEEKLGLRPHQAGSNIWVDALGTHVALGIGSHLGRQVLGQRFTAWEHRLSADTKILTDASNMSRNQRGGQTPLAYLKNLIGNAGQGPGMFPPGMVPSAAGVMGGSMMAIPRGEKMGSTVMMMSSIDGKGNSSRGSGLRTTGEASKGTAEGRTWLRLKDQTHNRHYLRIPEALYPHAEVFAEAAAAKPSDSPLESMGNFLGEILNAKPSQGFSKGARSNLLQEVFTQFHQEFVKGNDIHAVTRGLSRQKELVKHYQWARVELLAGGVIKPKDVQSPSAMLGALESGEIGFFPQFGGQANAYLGELKSLYETYPEVQPLVQAVVDVLQKDVASVVAQKAGQHGQGLDVIGWLRGEVKTPSEEYLSSSAVSQPLILLTQLGHYYSNMKALGLAPAELRNYVKGTTGHSQGVMASVVVAKSATEQDFIRNTSEAARYLLWQGIRMGQAHPETTINPDVVEASVAAGDGVPTSMLGILKLSPQTVQEYVARANQTLPADRQVEISLVNGPRAVVVSGHPEGLHFLRETLRKDEFKPSDAQSDQGRVPFSDRKLELVTNYFPVGAAFHTQHYMKSVPKALAADMVRLGITFNPKDLQVPVYSTFDGSNLQQSKDLTGDLIRMQSIHPVLWEAATAKASPENGVTHVVDYGPGGSAGIGAITARNKSGTGVQVILGGVLGKGSLPDRSYITDSNPAVMKQAPHWARDFGPKLVRLADGTVMVDTKFTRTLGKPPVMQAGMTPTSANETFMGAVINSGFHGELAGGGQHTEGYFRERVQKILEQVEPGEGITSNLLFLNAYLWGFQAPLVQLMAREGKPMDGITVAAGVPSPENAREVLTQFREAGIKHVAFKPGATQSIKDVVAIAKDNPETTVMIQWTGGRGGGHHSYEDAHDPILQTYDAIRRQPNILLVMGSGVGGGKDSLPYLTGEWSQSLGYPAMPFDAVLLGSRLMVAKEAQTAEGVKQLIVDAPGVQREAQWERTYQGPAGGVVTVQSELDAPIHKVATRGVELWKDFDNKYFSKPAEEAAAAIQKDKAEIIERINADYQKLYFGKKSDGRVADLEEMTYAEVADRMVELMTVAGEGDWIDVTFRDRAFDFFKRTEERFHREGSEEPALLQKPLQLEGDPQAFLKQFYERYPRAQSQLLATEDVDFFLALCKRPGKPVNFVPVIDKDLKSWFKKDSLWQSEWLAAVPGQDADRVAILQGPVAVKYSTSMDESVADIMGGINRSFIDHLMKDYGSLEKIPQVEYLGGPAVRSVNPAKDLPQVKVELEELSGSRGMVQRATLPKDPAKLPDAKTWNAFLAGNQPQWFSALLTTPKVVRGKDKAENILPTLFRPRPGQVVETRFDGDGKVVGVEIKDPLMTQLLGATGKNISALSVSIEGDNITVRLTHPRPATQIQGSKPITLELNYRYNPKQGYSPIHENMSDLNGRVKEFYSQLWSSGESQTPFELDSTFTGAFTLSRDHMTQFTRAVGNRHGAFVESGQETLKAPMDMAIVAAWQPLVQTLFPKAIDGNIFNLVHGSNGFRLLDSSPLAEGDHIHTNIKIAEVKNTDAGILVGVEGRLLRNASDYADLTSTFIIRGSQMDPAATFSRKSEHRKVSLSQPEDIAILRSKEWAEINEDVKFSCGEEITFEVENTHKFGSGDQLKETRSEGVIKRNGLVIGRVKFSDQDVSANLVEAYLIRHGEVVNGSEFFETGGYHLLTTPDVKAVPAENISYGKASFDLNPIHYNPYVADLAGHEGTLTHGMWTSANGRRVLEQYVAKNHPERVLSYEAQFVGKVFPGDQLVTQVKHVGMREGRMVVEVETVNQDGNRVLVAKGEVDRAPEAYVFTGQGSQVPGMGMELYETSPVAKKVWDRADTYMKDKYGFSILEIVQADPKTATELTISFGGPKGAEIRRNYMALTQEVVERVDGKTVRKTVPLFPEITEASESYTFKAPKGLLNATQFTQPALTLVEKAAFEDMKSKGLISPKAPFAGHSLGEYAALSSVADVLPVETLAEVVFLRGMTMQGAVPRDAKGRSPYGMAAVNPKKLGDDGLRQVVTAVAEATGQLLEVVNYNVDGQQYVVAGENQNLFILSEVLKPLRNNPAKLKDLPTLIAKAQDKAAQELDRVRQSSGDPGAPIKVSRGSIIPLEGIDVPFHSTVLRDGVPAFRSIIQQKIPMHIDIPRLVGTYVPNLTAKPFSLERSYVEEVYELTNSSVLKETLDNWSQASQDSQVLGRTLLMELLAYQFASPVRWIETQDLIFSQGTQRVVELGPGPVLTGMADRTLKSGKYPTMAKRKLLAYSSDPDALYFTGSDRGPSASDHAETAFAKNGSEADSQTAPEAPVPAPKPAAPAPAPAPVSAPVAPVATAAIVDQPVSALESLQVMIALKLGKSLSEISADKSIKDLVGGKSAVQNEILGDLQKEFGGGPDSAAEMKLSELSAAMGSGYSTLGKQTQGLTAKLVRDGMPGGFGMSQVKDYLATDRQLGSGRIEGLLLHALTMAPKARLGSEAEAKAWLDAVADSYGQKIGQAIPKGSAAAPAAMAAPMAAGPAAQPVPDQPVSALEALRVMLAIKLGKSVSDVAAGQSIKDLVGGKSAVQNEILGDLQKEFGGGPDNSAELSLSDLSTAVGSGYAGLGKHTQGLTSKLIRDTMPGGFGMAQVRDYLSGERLLGNGRVEGVLLHALTMAPKARFASDGEAKAWIDSVVDSYGSAQGINVPKASATTGVAVAGPASGVDSAEAAAYRKKVDKLIADQLRVAAEFLGEDPQAGPKLAMMERELRQSAEAELQAWSGEHGEDYFTGIQPIFVSTKSREYNSAWNWARQEAIEQFYQFDSDASVSQMIAGRMRLINRASPQLLEVVKFYADMAGTQKDLVKANYFSGLVKDIESQLGGDPTYRMMGPIIAPQVSVSAEGKVDYQEIPRAGVTDATAYVKEMSEGHDFKVDQASSAAMEPLKRMVRAQEEYLALLMENQAAPKLISAEAARLSELQGQLNGFQKVPYLFMKSSQATDPNSNAYDANATQSLYDAMGEMAAKGLSLKGKTVLVTGAGPGSIGIETVKAQLAAGAKVVVTTSNFSKKRTDYYQKLYQDFGAEGSELIVLPFNQASVQDVKALVNYIYDPAKGLGLDLDYVIPFAGISEQGMDIGNIGDRSELAHRIMMTNTIRLVGEVKNQKESRGILTKPAHVILPLSPNHGIFGHDGLYAESKLGLEAMKNKWSAEGWNKYISIGGAVIGWTRGTNLMEGNDLATPAIEAKGARTFSQREMAFNIMALMHPRMVKRAQQEPLWADFNGGFQMLPKLSGTMAEIRGELDIQSRTRRAAHLDGLEDQQARGTKTAEAPKPVAARENFDFAFPALPSKDRLEGLKDLQGMVNLEKVVVVAGFGEVSPWGNARTRWQMESKGKFSIEGCLEMAWIMGFVNFHRGPLGKNPNFVGWVDAATKEPIDAATVKERYEEKILEHSGIREIEPELFEGYDPHKKEFFRGYVFNQDMKPRAMDSKEDAESFKRRHGDEVSIYEKDGIWYADFKKGATVYIPRAINFDRFVAGQIPSGWDPARYGVPEEIIRQVDPTTLYLLVSTVEALVSAGVTDPYEFYEYIHVSELGNTQGGGMGGMRSIRRGFRERVFEKDVQGDILQEQLINVMPAWINMLLLSASGPIKTPVGACATAAESVDIGVETIQSGKAKVVFVGGYDDFGEEGTYEFAQMQATSSSKDQIEAQGRDPREHSRPSTSSRGGFMESQGAGAQILMSADLAIKMGLPIYGIVALTNTASDKQGESVPAPGQGILTTARETKGAWQSNPLLDMKYRQRELYNQLSQIHQWKTSQTQWIDGRAEDIRAQEGEQAAEDFLTGRKDFIAAQAARMERSAMDLWGNDFWKNDPSISPLRGALAVWGLTPDDIEISSFHGTSTPANDRNESAVNQKQMEHLGRTPGNPMLTIWQKSLTGHPKGAAAAWMFNGVVQSMGSGVVPGNRNADNIDPAFRDFNHLLFPNRSINFGRPLKAGLLKSFGFGQAGAEILLVHPDYLLATLDVPTLETYATKRTKREQKQYRYWQNTLTGRHPFFTPKSHPPYTEANETAVYLNPLARAKYDADKGTWMFPEASKSSDTIPSSGPGSPSSNPPPSSSGPNGRYGQTPTIPAAKRVGGALRSQMEGVRSPEDKGIGTDVQSIPDFKPQIENENFVANNFTAEEIAYCRQAANPLNSFTGRWAAKEAVLKAISDASPSTTNVWKGSGAVLKDIEVLQAPSGSLEVRLHGHAEQVAKSLGVTQIKVSISHDGDNATAVATAR